MTLVDHGKGRPIKNPNIVIVNMHVAFMPFSKVGMLHQCHTTSQVHVRAGECGEACGSATPCAMQPTEPA